MDNNYLLSECRKHSCDLIEYCRVAKPFDKVVYRDLMSNYSLIKTLESLHVKDVDLTPFYRDLEWRIANELTSNYTESEIYTIMGF